MKLKRAISLVTLLALLGGCAEYGGPLTKQHIGTALGAAGGAAAGSQMGKGSGRVGMIALGTLAGAALGGSFGSSLDKIDQQNHIQTSQHALETAPVGQPMTWRNPDSGNSGSVTPTRTYQQADGSYCREYRQTIVVNGKSQQAFGRACRQVDGSWQIVQ